MKREPDQIDFNKRLRSELQPALDSEVYDLTGCSRTPNIPEPKEAI